MGEIAGDVLWLVRPTVRRQVERNVAPWCGDAAGARRAGRSTFRNVGRYYVDMLLLPRRDLSRYVRESMALEPETIPRITAPGPAIIVSAHWGSPEVCLQAAIAHGRPFLAVVEALEPAWYARTLLALRQSHGGRYVDATAAGVRAALRELRAGGLVAFVADRDLAGSGICVELGGRRARIARGPWELAARTGARIVPVFTARRTPSTFTIELCEPYTVEPGRGGAETAAQRFAWLLDERIGRAPGQWTVLEDFWQNHGCRRSGGGLNGSDDG